jgi:hypothetical protein
MAVKLLCDECHEEIKKFATYLGITFRRNGFDDPVTSVIHQNCFTMPRHVLTEDIHPDPMELACITVRVEVNSITT